MKAIVQTGYGSPDVLHITDLPKPTIRANELRIKVAYANVASGDARVRALDMPLLLKPIIKLIFGFHGLRRKIPGVSGSGIVESVGENVTRFKKGDRVHFINGLKMGACADYVIYNENNCIVKTPSNINLKEAAPLAFGLLTAYHFINNQTVNKGSNVLIYGASGSVGTYAVQLAKHYQANVTAVSSINNHALLSSLGAFHMIDYHQTDVTKQKTTYDVIFDAVGFLKKKDIKPILNANGKFLTVKSMTKESQSMLSDLNNILKTEHIQSVIEKVYPFELIREAHQHVDTHRKVGNVLLEVNTNKH